MPERTRVEGRRRSDEAALSRRSRVTHGAGRVVTLYRAIPCPEGCGCNYGSEALLRMDPDAADALADELRRCARYARDREDPSHA